MPLLARALIGLLVSAAGYGNFSHAGSALDVGERIYREGLLPSGASVQGSRGAGSESAAAAGAMAACANCHRRSGLGSAEGSIRIPPITSKYLFDRSGVQAGRPTLTAVSASDARREAYDDSTLSTAIRSGVGRGSRVLSDLMPRYTLDADSMAALIAYIKSLPTTVSPGVSDSTIEFATIVTPDADPGARDGMLAVLDQFIADKNSFIRGGARPLRSQGQIDFRVTRRWQLHIWTLSGAPETWEAQLGAHLRADPVFAVLSGIGGPTWGPVHRFCERARLPCLFPNVELPIDSESDFYSVYFSRGVLLESELIANRVTAGAAAGRVVQVYTRGDSGEGAAARLNSLTASSFETVRRPIPAGNALALAEAIRDVRPGDTLVLWLRPADLRLLGRPPPATTTVYISGLLAGLEHTSLPASWRAVAEMTYPVDLPEARSVRMNYPLRWFQIRKVAVVAERVQADTYLACGIVSEALSEMLDSFMRDYLIERIESMVSHRQLTGYFPHLGLGPGQRFASKGGYIVRFTEPGGSTVAPMGDWIVP